MVGPRAALAVGEARIEGLNWLGEDQREVGVKVRSLSVPVPARIEGDRIVFARPEYGVSPGQAAVFYEGERVLGGGWIAQTATPGAMSFPLSNATSTAPLSVAA